MVKRLLLVLLAWLALPASAHATDCCAATLVARDLPLGLVRTIAGVPAPATFDLVGLHWQGPGRVLFRTRSVSGRWSVWRSADVDDHVSPDGPEGATSRRWRLGEPYWTGLSDRIDYRVLGKVSRLRAFYVSSPVEAIPYRTVSIAGSPQIIPRAAWSANEAIRKGPPLYAPAVTLAIVHHTAGTNAYGPLQSPAIVRAIEVYHVKANGWKDIGYNFLVDRFGRVFEGRYGGIDRNVVGAHSEGFNRGSFGVAVIGNYTSKSISTAARQALVKLLAWRLDVAHVDPLSTLTFVSGGNARFPTGTPVFLRAISGHRDTGFTDCPGTAFYRQLPAIAAQVAATGLPKLYSPVVHGKIGGPVQFTARLSAPLAWDVTVTSGTTAVATGSGTGTAISFTWDSSSAAPGHYTWTIEAGPTVRPATGTITGTSVPPPPRELLSGLAVTPVAVSPNGDGFADTAMASYTLGAHAAVTAQVKDSSGAVVQTLFTGQEQGARQITFALPVDQLADGRYTLSVDVTADDGRTATADAAFLVDRSLSGLVAVPSPFSPNGGMLSFAFTLAKPVQATVTVFREGSPLAVVFQGPLPVGAQSIPWDGQLPSGQAPDGHYEVVVTVTDDVGEISQSASFDVALAGT